MSFQFINKTLRLNNLKTRTAMNAKISVFVTYVEVIVYLLLYNLHGCTFKYIKLRSSRPEVFLGEGALKICSKFTGEHPCLSAISIKLQSNFTEIAFRHECSPLNLLHIFRIPFPKNTPGRLLLKIVFLNFISFQSWKISNWKQWKSLANKNALQIFCNFKCRRTCVIQNCSEKYL